MWVYYTIWHLLQFYKRLNGTKLINLYTELSFLLYGHDKVLVLLFSNIAFGMENVFNCVNLEFYLNQPTIYTLYVHQFVCTTLSSLVECSRPLFKVLLKGTPPWRQGHWEQTYPGLAFGQRCPASPRTHFAVQYNCKQSVNCNFAAALTTKVTS